MCARIRIVDIENREVRRRLMINNLRRTVVVFDFAISEPALELHAIGCAVQFFLDNKSAFIYTMDEATLLRGVGQLEPFSAHKVKGFIFIWFIPFNRIY